MAERFVDNAAAFTEALGVKHAPTIVWLSMIPWRDASERSAFIKATTGMKQGRAFTEVARYPRGNV